MVKVKFSATPIAHNNSCVHRTFSNCAKDMNWRLLLLFSFKDKPKYIGIVPTHSQTPCDSMCMCFVLPCQSTFHLFPVAATSLQSFLLLLHPSFWYADDGGHVQAQNTHTRELNSTQLNSQITYTTLKRKTDAAQHNMNSRRSVYTVYPFKKKISGRLSYFIFVRNPPSVSAVQEILRKIS